MRTIVVALALMVIVGFGARAAETAAAGVGWQYDLAMADSLFQHGYLDAAQEDYQKIVANYPNVVPAVDRGWLGLGKVYDARGDATRAKACFEQVLERNSDTTAVNEARAMYVQEKKVADAELVEAERSVSYFEYRYYNTSWLDIFNKIFCYVDLRKARKTLDTKTTAVKSFDPRYLIPPVVTPVVATGDAEFAVSAEELSQILKMVPEEEASTLAATGAGTTGTGTTAIGTPDGGTATAETPVAEPTTAPISAVATSTEIEELKARRETYLAAYRDLQAALKTKNQVVIQTATSTFQQAVAAYNTARAAVAEKSSATSKP